MFTATLLKITQLALIFLSVLILLRSLRSMLREKRESETWAWLRVGEEDLPITHWENIIGSARSADLRIFGSGVRRIHAILRRREDGSWAVYQVFHRGGVWVNGMRARNTGEPLRHGDIINLGGSCVRFIDLTPEEKRDLERSRTMTGKRIHPGITLFELTLLQLFLALQHLFTASSETIFEILLAFLVLAVLQWALYAAMKLMDRNGFEVETLAFYLTTLGVSVAASSEPESMFKHMLLVMVAIVLFLLLGLWLRNTKRTESFIVPIALLSLGLLALNAVSGSTENGATNWLTLWGYSFQPSEFVKVGYIYTGAATLDQLYHKKNLFIFTVFSAICVLSLALMGDFGTALIFFATFLIISFMRSGSIATVVLAVTGAVMAATMAISVKPYIARRFASWGHVWEDVYDTGYQQTRAMSAAASGGLLGKGAGAGWLKNIFAADTDMVFALICEELGLIIAVCMVLALILLAFFAVRNASRGRSAYSAIAACATMNLLLVQLALNVFGSLDILPFTGVTFPFVSRGGSSLLSCWMLMAFLKMSDNRKGASFVVKPPVRAAELEEWEEPEDSEKRKRKSVKPRKKGQTVARGEVNE